MTTPTPKQLPSGKWRVQIRVGGKRISITRATKRECTKEAERVRARYIALAETPSAASSLLLTKAIDYYIESRTNVLSPATIRSYRMIQRTRFQEYMYLPLSRINWQVAINSEVNKCAPQTVKNAWSLIKAVLSENGMTVTVKLPPPILHDKGWLDPDQIVTFLDAIRDKPCELAALLALHSLRRSEIFGLQWEDIDLTERTIRIHSAFVINENGSHQLKPQGKTVASNRTVPILIPRLYELLAEQNKKTGPVLTCYLTTPYKQIRSICDSLGFERIGVHSLRHSFASLAYHCGLSEMSTMRLGGWSNYGTMRKIYTHLSEKDRQKDVEKMRDFFKSGTQTAHAENGKP